jgi:hypothetical protein
MRIAQRLDELAEDGPSELTALSEELGRIADTWPEPPKPRPRYLEEMEHLFRRAVEEEMFRREYPSRSNHASRIAMDLRYPPSLDPFKPVITGV